MIDFEASYSTSKPCNTGEGSYFSRLRSRATSGHIHKPVFVGLGGAVPNLEDTIPLARGIWQHAQDQNTDPRIQWHNRQPLLMDVGRICLRSRHEDSARTNIGHRFELLGSIVITGEWQTRYDDLNVMASAFDSTGLGQLRVTDRNIRALHPALATATVQTWGGYPVHKHDEQPIQYGLETRSTRRSPVAVFFAMRGDEHVISLADMLATETAQTAANPVAPQVPSGPEDTPPF